MTPLRSVLLSATLLIGGCLVPLPEFADPCEPYTESGLFTYKYKSDETKAHKAYVWLPSNDKGGPRKMVFVLHGGNSDGQTAANVTGYIDRAEAEGFVAVFPQGRGVRRHWQYAEGYGTGSHDDVLYLDALADELATATCTEGLIATGFSQGGMMTHRWACEGDNPPDAIVPASGTLNSAENLCLNGDPIPVRHYHGTKDGVIPYDGGVSPKSTIREKEMRSVAETMDIWRERNGCSKESVVEDVTDTVSCEAWSCTGAATELCTLDGWAHVWPGGQFAGKAGIDATRDGFEWALSTFEDDLVADEESGI